MSDFNPVKFQINSPEIVELSFDQPKITDSPKFPGKKIIWYGIKTTVNGYNGFNATESLHFMIQQLGLKKGNTLEIKKMQGEKFTYFTVNGKTKDEIVASAQEAVNSTQPETEVQYDNSSNPNDQEKLNILWAEYQKSKLPF
tara:strand:- start:97 stop:522 length:426 start_codon:yes stop_codon:yes gene_type:complete